MSAEKSESTGPWVEVKRGRSVNVPIPDGLVGLVQGKVNTNEDAIVGVVDQYLTRLILVQGLDSDSELHRFIREALG